jgi:hypothetical protein
MHNVIWGRDATSVRLQMLQQLLSHPYIMIHRTNNNGRTALALAKERMTRKLTSNSRKYYPEQERSLDDSYAMQQWTAYRSLLHIMIQK